MVTQTILSHMYVYCIEDMIDLGLFFLEKSFSQVFGRKKLHKKGSRIVLFMSLRNC